MVRRLRPHSPPAWTVLGLTDRGRSARELCRRMVRVGWHPCRRLNQGAKFRPAGQVRWDWRRALVGQVGPRWRGGGTACALAGLPPGMHAGGLGGGEGHEGTLVHPHRFRPQPGVTPGGMGCGPGAHRASKAPKGRLAVAIDAHDRPGTGRTVLAGSGGGHAVEESAWAAPLTSARPSRGQTGPDLRGHLLGLPAAGKPRRTRLFWLGGLWLLVCQRTARPFPLP